MKAPAAPARSAERQRLAAAIARHAEAVERVERTNAASGKVFSGILDTLEPAVTRAEKRLADVRAFAPDRRALVDAVLAGNSAVDATEAKEAETALATAQRKLDEARQLRRLLDDEMAAASAAVDAARRNLDAAVHAVVTSDDAARAVRAEFHRCAKRALRLARVLRQLGVVVGGVSVPEVGLSFTGIAFYSSPREAGRPGSSFDDPDWAATLAALREDADAVLPGLPPPEPDDPDAGDRDDRQAAA